MLEIHLRHLQYVAAVCKEHIPALTVFRHILVLAFLERFQFGRVITFNPAGLVKTQRLPNGIWHCTHFPDGIGLPRTATALPYR